MDLVRLESTTRDFELFLSRGASLVPEPVYERDTRKHVENIGDRTPLEEYGPADVGSDEEVLEKVTIDFVHRTVKVEIT
jgi:hypothetical protein